MSLSCPWILVVLALTVLPAGAAASDRKNAATSSSSVRTRPLTRLLYEDHATQSLRWFDVLIDDRKRLTATPVAAVSGVKEFDVERQKLVQLRESQGLVVAGVRDDDEGKFESGWVLVDSGVRYRDHGDHGHWSFREVAHLAASTLDQHQGNPAHVYVYDGRFFVANDQKGGYTRIDPAAFLDPAQRSAALSSVRFIAGGGNHITLAVAGDKVGYSCWIDGSGPNQGRVDVTRLDASAAAKPAYSFSLPTGGIHGAAISSGRVFFAPSDGVCWTDVDWSGDRNADDVQVHHIPLGSHDDKPRRTGAFATFGRHLVFTVGKQEHSQLAILDTADARPKPVFVKLPVKEGAMAVSPVVEKTANGRVLAFVFHDHPADVEMEDQLTIIDLDPNRDGRFSDAKIAVTIAVGPSAVEGHYGHHAIAFDAQRQYGFLTNPGGGTVTALKLGDLGVAGEFNVVGRPTAVVAVGGREIRD